MRTNPVMQTLIRHELWITFYKDIVSVESLLSGFLVRIIRIQWRLLRLISNFHPVLVITETPISEIDVVFAITATSTDWSATFQQMKDTITSVLNTYSMDMIRVGVIVFGIDAETEIQLQENLDDNLQNSVSILFPKFGVPDLDKALNEARRLFAASGRPNARKVLVVISDRDSSSSPSDIKSESKRLDDEEIVVVSVVIGKEIDPKELVDSTPYKVIDATKDDDPIVLGRKIMELVLKGKT